MDRLDSSKKGGRAGRDNLLPKRVPKQPKDNGRQVVIEAKDVYSTISSPDNTKRHEHSSHEQRQDIQVRKSSMPTSTSTKGENGKPSNNLNAFFVRRLSQSGVSPGSQEFQFVLRGFMPPKESEVVKPNSQVGKTKNRKISFNDYGRASQAAKRMEEMSLSPRHKRSLDMLNAPTISSINRAVDHRKTENNGKTTQSRGSFPFSSIKEAWQESESSLQASRVDKRRHVSLPAPPPGFYLDKKQETLIESYKAEKAHRKDSSSSSSPFRSKRKISTVISPNLYEMKSAGAAGSPKATATEGEINATHRKVSPGGDLVGCAEPESFESQPRKISPALNTELSKIKQISAANGHDLHPNLLLGIKSKQAGSDGELLDEFGSNDDEHQAALKARKNFQRIGKAAVAARRFLGIQSRETAGLPKQHYQRAISPLAKSETEPFDQMVEEMKCSYQGLQLGPKTEGEKYN